MDDRERHELIHAGKQLLIRRAKLAAIVLPLVFALQVIDWVWPDATRQALAPLKMLVSTLGL